MSGAVKPRVMRSPGPIADAFLRSRAFIKICVGPVGSGKTMAMLNSGLLGGARQGAVDGPGGVRRRKARVGVIRESYPALRSTTLKSWFRVVPESEGQFNWSAPFTHQFSKILKRDRQTNRPTEIADLEYEFRGIGDQSVEEACRSWEINIALVEELDLQPEDLVPFLTGRVGRFSDLDPSLVVDPQIVCVMNMPPIDHWAYRLAFDGEIGGLSGDEKAALEKALGGRKLIETFVQPGGMTAKAENLHNLPGATPEDPQGGRGYYILQIAANKHKPGYVDRMVHNKPVPTMHGLPVNENFSYVDHVRPITWDPRRLLVVGIDQGLFAAAALTQRTILGQLRTLGELVNLDDRGRKLVKVSGQTFGKRLRQKVLERCPGIQANQVRFVADPAAFNASDREENDYDWIKAVEGELGFPIYMAKSNSLSLRHEAVWQAQDERDGYAIDPSCKHLIKAHMGGYHYAKAENSSGEAKGHLAVADTIYTHIADGEQYAALEGENVVLELHGHTPRPAGSAVVNDSDYNIFGD